MTNGSKIRFLRERKGLSLEAAAARIGVSRQQWHQWETGKRHPRIDTLERIAGALDMSVVGVLSVVPDESVGA